MTQKITQKQFIGERARALAVVYLTRREDLIVTEENNDVGVDLWVTLNLEGKVGQRKFAVELRGSRTAVDVDQANRVLQPSMQAISRYGPFPFPVAVFFFTMEKNEGWFTWAAEPVASADGEFELIHHAEASCRPLTSGAIDGIVEAVDRWYDAFFDKAIRETPSRRRGRSPK